MDRIAYSWLEFVKVIENRRLPGVNISYDGSLALSGHSVSLKVKSVKSTYRLAGTVERRRSEWATGRKATGLKLWLAVAISQS